MSVDPPARSAPSAHDVARAAGVSQAAVSRAFTKGASIAPATRDKVMSAARSLGYRPNLLARSLKEGRSGIVGIVLGNPRNPFYMAALEALSLKLAAAGKHMLVFTAEGNAAGDVQVQDLLNYRVDALILMSTSLSSPLARQCRAEGVPVIFFNRHAQDMAEIDSVTGNNYAGAQAIAAHLLEGGYRRLAFMAGFTDSSTSHEREAGFRDFLARHGAAEPGFAVGHYQRAGAMAAARQLLASAHPPDAIFCANDHMAIATIEVAQAEFGLVIGRDLGVAGFDDIDLASWPSFRLTTYSQPIEAMTDAVVARLLDAPDAHRDPHAVIGGALCVRRSTIRG